MDPTITMDESEDELSDTTNDIPKLLFLNETENDITMKELEGDFKFVESNDSLHIISIPSADTVEGDSKASWTRQMTKALIVEYSNMFALFKNPEKKQKDLWMILARNMQRKGFKVTWTMCDRKFRNLKSTYRTIEYSNRSLKSKKRWEYYEDLSKLVLPYPRFQRPLKLSTSPKTTSEKYLKLSNGAVLKATVSEPTEIIQQSTPVSVASSTNVKEETINESAGSADDTPVWFKKFLVQFKTEQDNVLQRIQEMHKETKEIEIKKIKLLENIMTLLQTKK